MKEEKEQKTVMSVPNAHSCWSRVSVVLVLANIMRFKEIVLFIYFFFWQDSYLIVAALCKARFFFSRSNIGIVGSNPTQRMDVCLRLFCICVVLFVGSGLATGRSPVQLVLPTVLGLKKLSETKRFTDALFFKVGAIGYIYIFNWWDQ
jgi:hypothetical protein